MSRFPNWRLIASVPSSSILHTWKTIPTSEVFTYGDIVIDSRRPWWGPMMYVGPARHAPGGVSVAMSLDQPDASVSERMPFGYLFVVQNEDMRHAL